MLLNTIFLALCVFAGAETRAAVLYYVNVNSTNPTAPYADWSTAATTIQDAVDAAVADDEVLVTNGIYQPVLVNKRLIVQSVSGPQFTAIDGRGSNRCAYLGNAARLSGFTLTNGAAVIGGGLFCEGITEIASNCVLIGNSASFGGGGGAGKGTLRNCTLINNRASDRGGGAFESMLENCTLRANFAGIGGGASFSILNRCMLVDNRAYYGGGADSSELNDCTVMTNVGLEDGGGVYDSVLYNCKLIGNSAKTGGGGARDSSMTNCILRGNSANYGGGVLGSTLNTLNNCTLTDNSALYEGGGVLGGALNNCIVYFNTARVGPNYSERTRLTFSCTTPLPSIGVGNISNEPVFVDYPGGNLRLQSNSPCINAGDSIYVSSRVDHDGRPRVIGVVDMGAYEFQGPFMDWLGQYSLPTDGPADFADPDDDRLNNWQEWIAGTVPTNGLSVLRLLTATVETSGVALSWQSVSNRFYSVERANDLGTESPFLVLKTNIVGQAGTTSFTDSDVTGGGPFFYRVGVQ